jgi:Flp pilus assembly protein TadG
MINLSSRLASRHQNGRPRNRRRGTAITEFAVMSPLFLMLLGGTMDFSRLFSQSMALHNAARAGAQYAIGKDSNMYDLQGIQNAAIASQPNMTGITAQASIVCKLPPDDATTQGDGATVTCGTVSGYVRQYLQITTTKNYELFSTYLALPTNFTLKGSAVVRLQ